MTLGPAVTPFAREEELRNLGERLKKRDPFLLFGAAGVGKTLLLKTALRQIDSAGEYIYCSGTANLGQWARQVCAGLALAGDAFVGERLRLDPRPTAPQIQAALQAKSSLAVQGIVRQALRDRPRTLVCDHTRFVSQPFYSYVKDLLFETRAGMVSVARTFHMEEIGFLANLFADRRSRFELPNFDAERAARFAGLVSESHGLDADNREEFLEKVVELSQGNPAAILRMVEMAGDRNYRRGRLVKMHTLYVDYCLRYSGVRR